MERINKHSRAGQSGKYIMCPKCRQAHKVYHFAWSASQCSHCKKMINKEDYFSLPTEEVIALEIEKFFNGGKMMLIDEDLELANEIINEEVLNVLNEELGQACKKINNDQ